MGPSRKLIAAAAIGLLRAATVQAGDAVFENFENEAETRWEFITDGVMGGVSDGSAVMARIDGDPALRMTGTVSTENNGGFIQTRRMLPDGLPLGTTAIELDVRGNSQPYYVFIRTSEMTRPWYFYNARFEAGTEWETIRLPLSAFERSHAHLSEAIVPEDGISIGLVAYGRDYEADLMVREIRLD
ncbi:MAG: CIA30 family protein [Pseudomonadota bacterium]